MDIFEMQPNESLDYDVDASEFVPEGDAIASLEDATAVADSAVASVDSVDVLTNTSFKVWVTALTQGTSKVSIKVTTASTPPRIAFHEFKVKVKEK
jgi:hypothetical protein